MKKVLKILVLILLSGILIFICYFFIGFSKPAEKIIWGVNFSQKHSNNLGLNWKENYLAILDDLGVKNLKLVAYWDLIEPEEGIYNFKDLDWQISEAEKRGAKVILVIGIKTPRWPECHEPFWVKNKDFSVKKKELLEYIKKTINRYKNLKTIWAWQVENEPFFPFGECPKFNKDLLKEEINLVKTLDFQKRPVIISESGELPFWFRAAKYGDMVGITIYRKVWFKEIKSYISYPFPPVFYQRKRKLINMIFDKEVICVELQTEPWGPELLYSLPLKEQERSMNLEQFKKNIEFAKKTGLKKFYLWGAEWWFWLKENQGKSEIWEEAKNLFGAED